jgi:L-alanine-DL-glutamate epimerase-like enolase superfamily enzyme
MTERRLDITTKSWPLREPFAISRGVQTTSEVVIVQLSSAGNIGRGEAAGVDYHGETPESMRAQIESVRGPIEAGASRRQLLELLPAGGARNAVDAALWDLEAKSNGRSVFDLAGVGTARMVTSAITIGIRPAPEYEARARTLADYEWIKIKVAGEQALDAIAAVRRGAPHSKLIVDANQAWTPALLASFVPKLVELRVDLLEQPVAATNDAGLVDIDCPIPICADEAADTAADLPRLVDRYDFVNIKLDKTGGLTAALDFAHAAQAAGLRLMVGCMVGGSIAMAPAMVLGQLCEVADLDGPLLQAEDWPAGIQYTNGRMNLPSPELWG